MIATTDNLEISKVTYHDCKVHHILVNVPASAKLSEFYVGSKMAKGHVEIAIFTNGKHQQQQTVYDIF